MFQPKALLHPIVILGVLVIALELVICQDHHHDHHHGHHHDHDHDHAHRGDRDGDSATESSSKRHHPTRGRGDHYENEAVVTTPLGDMEGTVMTSRLGRKIFAFRGIRYAKAPVGELRFKPPVPVERWQGVYNATEDAPLCPQPPVGTLPVSEDCLFLNVYTPKIRGMPSKIRQEKFPVIIHLHSGAFYVFGGRSDWYGPQYLLDQDVVLVTFAYRLGTLGFLSLGKESPGNNGLKDQVAVLKWVQKNIAAFGGDPGSVTLWGYSAGAWSVTLHMVSPMSRGLFHKGIIGSGTALGHWKLPNLQVDVAREQAQIAGCKRTETSQEIFDCLKQASAVEMGNSLSQFFKFGSHFVWSPVIENDYGQERFLSEHPIKLIKRGEFMKIPIIVGYTQEEFSYVGIDVARNSTMLNELSNNWETLAPLTFLYERGTPKSREVSAKARKYYLGDGPLTKQSEQGLRKLYFDSVVAFPVTRTARLLAKESDRPVYFYEFNFIARYSFYLLPGTNETIGVVHHDDLMYLFHLGIALPYFNVTDPEYKMVEKLTLMWANFAATGDPTPGVKDFYLPDRKLDFLDWTPYNEKTDQILNINRTLKFKDRPAKDRYRFWADLYPISDYLQ